MRIRKFNFNKAKLFDSPDLLVFLKPLGGRLTRVYKIPELNDPDKTIELVQVLNTLCTKKHNDVWYFNLSDPEDEKTIMDTFLLMDISPIITSLDKDPKQSN